MPSPSDSEWLEADGLGGFASGTVAGPRSRHYHALLLVATTPPTGRLVLVNGFDAWVTTRSGTFALSSQAYTPGVTHPDGSRHIAGFTTEPWPTWTFRLDDDTVVEQEIFVPKGAAAAVVCWRLAAPARPAQRTAKRAKRTAAAPAASSGRRSPAGLHEAVETHFRTAMEVAHRQQARSFELRAAMSLSRLWQHQGKRQQAREMLGEIYGWFTEGVDTADLRDAQDLLATLA